MYCLYFSLDDEDLPILIALVSKDNMTNSSPFAQVFYTITCCW